MGFCPDLHRLSVANCNEATPDAVIDAIRDGNCGAYFEGKTWSAKRPLPAPGPTPTPQADDGSLEVQTPGSGGGDSREGLIRRLNVLGMSDKVSTAAKAELFGDLLLWDNAVKLGLTTADGLLADLKKVLEQVERSIGIQADTSQSDQTFQTTQGIPDLSGTWVGRGEQIGGGYKCNVVFVIVQQGEKATIYRRSDGDDGWSSYTKSECTISASGEIRRVSTGDWTTSVTDEKIAQNYTFRLRPDGALDFHGLPGDKITNNCVVRRVSRDTTPPPKPEHKEPGF